MTYDANHSRAEDREDPRGEGGPGDPAQERALGQLVPLGKADDFEVAEGNPDVRGWDVKTPDNRKVGEVHELIVDTVAMKVRYLDVELDKKAIGAKDDRHVLVPIGSAQLSEEQEEVRLSRLTDREIVHVPEYRHGPITRIYERSVCRHYGDTSGELSTAEREGRPDFYGYPYFDEGRFFEGRHRDRESDAYLRSRRR